MKQFLRFKTFLMLAAISLFAGNQVWADETETITFSELSLENSTQYTDPFVSGDVSVTFAGGSNDGKYYTTGAGIRTYGGGTITIEASGYTITNVNLTFSGASYAPTAATVWTSDGTGSGTTGVSASWTGSATEIVLTRPTGSGHWRLQKVEVTYESDPSDTRASLTFSFSQNSYSLEAGAEAAAFVAPTLSITDGSGSPVTLNEGDVAYMLAENSGEGSLSVDAATGAVEIGNDYIGTFKVTAGFMGNDTYKEASASYTVNVVQPLDIAGVRALDDNASGLLKFVDAKVLAVSGTQYAWVRDDSGALLLYNSGLSLTAGQVINGKATVKKTTYRNQIETTGTIDGSELVITEGEEATPVDVNTADAPDYDSDLVKLSGVTLTGSVIDGDNDITVYDGRFNLGYTFVDGTQYDIVGIMGVYNSTIQIYPISVTESESGDDPGVVAAPTLNPAGGEVEYGTEVTITAAEGCTIKYTTDATDPYTSETAVETESNTATVVVYEDMSIYAVAFDADGNSSETVTADYTIAVRIPDAPVISEASGEVPAGTVVTVSYSDENASLIITTDGSDPADMNETAEVYDFDTNADLVADGTLTVSYTINEPTTIRAIVMDNIMGGISDEATASYTISLEVPSFQPLNDISGYTVKGNKIYTGDESVFQVYVIGSTTNATWYTLDGSDPTTSTTVKKITAATMNQRINTFGFPGVAVNLTDGCTLRAATYDAANNVFSNVVDFGYYVYNGEPVIAAGTYAKVTSNADIEDGKNYILVYEGAEGPAVFTGEISSTSTKYGLSTAAEYSDPNEINISELSVTPVVINAVSDGYTIQVGDEYLAWSSGNSLKSQEDAYSWSIDVEDTDAKSTISSVAESTRLLQYNSISPRFACYTGTQNYVAIYKELQASETFEELPIVITSAGYSTLYYSDKDIELPVTGAGITVRAYTITFDGTKISEGDEFVSGDKIPAGTAVVLEEYDHNAITFTAKAYEPSVVADPVYENYLYGFDEDTDLDFVFGADYFVFYKLSGSPSGVVGFYWNGEGGAPFVSAAHKAALVIPKDEAAGIRGFSLSDGTATAIQSVEVNAAANDKVYDLQGRRVQNAQKGVFIINGKKVIK